MRPSPIRYDGDIASRDVVRAAAVLVMTAAIGMAVLAWQRGPWLDEFWTLWLTDPAVRLGRSYADNWSQDVHPPLYYALVWSVRQLPGDSLTALRFINALPLLILVPTVLAWRRRRPDDRRPAVFIGLMVGCPFVLAYFAELRSYFSTIMLSASVVMQLRLLRWGPGDLGKADRGLAVLIAGTIVIALNLHFFSSAIIAAVIAVEGLQLLLARRWWAAALLVTASTVGIALLAAALAVFLTKSAPYYSYPATAFECIQIVGTAIAVGAGLNLGVDLALLQTLRRGLPIGRGLRWGLAALAVGTLLLLAQSIGTGSLTLRHTFVLLPVAAALAADFGTQALVGSRTLVAVFLVGGLVVQGIGIVHEAHNKRWLTLVPQLQALTRACPTSRIVAVDQNALVPPARRGRVAGWIGAFDYGYRWIAQRQGLTVTTTREDRDTVVPAGSCPVLLWSEHDFGDIPSDADLVARARVRFDKGRPSAIEGMENDGRRRLLILRPPRPELSGSKGHTG